MLCGARPPVLAQLAEVEVFLAFAGLDGRALGGVEPHPLVLVHALYDLLPSRRELLDHASRHAGELRPTLVRGGPFDPERAGELVPELRLVEVARGEPVSLEDRLTVEGTPLAV